VILLQQFGQHVGQSPARMPNCQYPKRLQEARPSRMVSIKPKTRLLRIYISLLPKKKMISLLLILQIILILRVTLKLQSSVVVVLDASTSSRPPTSLSSLSSTSSSSGRSTRVSGSRAPCSRVQGGAAPSERQSEAIKGIQEAIKRHLTPRTCSRRS